MRLLSETRWVDTGGRTYECGPATLATVVLAVDLFGVQVDVCLAERERLTAADAKQILRACRPADLARVLATCVRGRPPAGIDDLTAVALVVLELTDIPAAVAALDAIDAGQIAAAEALAQDGEPTPGDVAVVTLAARFGCAPHEVYGWPYSVFLVAARCLPLLRLHDGDRPAERGSAGAGASVHWDAAFDGSGITAKAPVN